MYKAAWLALWATALAFGLSLVAGIAYGQLGSAFQGRVSLQGRSLPALKTPGINNPTGLVAKEKGLMGKEGFTSAKLNAAKERGSKQLNNHSKSASGRLRSFNELRDSKGKVWLRADGYRLWDGKTEVKGLALPTDFREASYQLVLLQLGKAVYVVRLRKGLGEDWTTAGYQVYYEERAAGTAENSSGGQPGWRLSRESGSGEKSRFLFAGEINSGWLLLRDGNDLHSYRVLGNKIALRPERSAGVLEGLEVVALRVREGTLGYPGEAPLIYLDSLTGRAGRLSAGGLNKPEQELPAGLSSAMGLTSKLGNRYAKAVGLQLPVSTITYAVPPVLLSLVGYQGALSCKVPGLSLADASRIATGFGIGKGARTNIPLRKAGKVKFTGTIVRVPVVLTWLVGWAGELNCRVKLKSIQAVNEAQLKSQAGQRLNTEASKGLSSMGIRPPASFTVTNRRKPRQRFAYTIPAEAMALVGYGAALSFPVKTKLAPPVTQLVPAQVASLHSIGKLKPSTFAAKHASTKEEKLAARAEARQLAEVQRTGRWWENVPGVAPPAVTSSKEELAAVVVDSAAKGNDFVPQQDEKSTSSVPFLTKPYQAGSVFSTIGKGNPGALGSYYSATGFNPTPGSLSAIGSPLAGFTTSAAGFEKRLLGSAQGSFTTSSSFTNPFSSYKGLSSGSFGGLTSPKGLTAANGFTGSSLTSTTSKSAGLASSTRSLSSTSAQHILSAASPAAGLLVGKSPEALQLSQWLFGAGAYVSFAGSAPTAKTGSRLIQLEGSASIADSSGNLLYYASGGSLFNGEHKLITAGLKGHSSSTTGALFVPAPGYKQRYYLFTVGQGGYEGPAEGVHYSILEKGELLEKNRLLTAAATEKLAATEIQALSDKNEGYWIVVREGNRFASYPLTKEGIGKAVYSAASSPGYGEGTIGQLKLSPSGTFLAEAVSTAGRVSLYSFDAHTGAVGKETALTSRDAPIAYPYGLAFNQAGNQLYVASGRGSSIYSYVVAPSEDSGRAIRASRKELKGDSKYIGGALELAIDGNIYAARKEGPAGRGATALGRIAGDSYQEDALPLGGGMSSFGLPSQLASHLRPAHAAFSASSFCTGTATVFTNRTRPGAGTYHWQFGDGGESQEESPSHVYAREGIYQVKLKASWSRDSVLVVDSVVHTAQVSSPAISTLPDEVRLPAEGSLPLTATSSAAAVLWSTGSTQNTITVTQPGTYTAHITRGACESLHTTTVLPRELALHAGETLPGGKVRVSRKAEARNLLHHFAPALKVITFFSPLIQIGY